MRIKPVKRTAAPRYPDSYTVDLDSLLRGNVPVRWSASPAAGVVLSAVVMLGLAGCSTKAGGGGAIPGNTAVTDSVAPTPAAGGIDEAITFGVPMQIKYETPFFEHGDGIGVYGCSSVAAPMFLSEDDAFAIIRDEFAKLELTVSRESVTFDNVQIPVTTTQYDPNSTPASKTRKGSLSFDFSVQDRDIVMEYVSSEDIGEWADDEEGVWSSVSQEDYIGAARTLNTSLNELGRPEVHGVFYEPTESYEYREGSGYNLSSAEAHERSSEQLREQVRDFIAWLVASGIV